MSAQQQIEKLRTLQESMHDIADKVVSLGDGSVMLNDVADGKKQIADAINTKGGSANADSSFQQLAEDIENLNDSFITYGVTADPKIDWLQFICSNNSTYRSTLLKIERDDIEEISKSYAFAECINLHSINLQNLSSITTGNVFSGCLLLNSIIFPNLSSISGGYVFSNCKSLKKLSLPKLNSISGNNNFGQCTALEELDFPDLINFGGNNTTLGCTMLRNIVLGVLRSMGTATLAETTTLRNITIGQGTNINLPLQNWKATSVINEGQSGIDELNGNLRTNLLEKLADHSTDGQTRTLRIGWLARVSQENIDYANSKGWTLTT